MDLVTTGDTITLFVIAAIAGAVGGVVADLLLVHNRQSGMIELPHRTTNYVDLGTIASVLVGAVAAMIGIYIFPPATITTVTNGVSSTVVHYDLYRLIPLSLLIGSAGSAFLAAAQSRVTAAAAQQQLQTTKSVANSQLAHLAEQAAGLGKNTAAGTAKLADPATQDVGSLLTSIDQARDAINMAGEST